MNTKTLTDLNDFITPSQVCIKPVEVKNAIPIDPKEVAAVGVSLVAQLCRSDDSNRHKYI
jgi:hypothetical protein